MTGKKIERKSVDMQIRGGRNVEIIILTAVMATGTTATNADVTAKDMTGTTAATILAVLTEIAPGIRKILFGINFI